MCTMAIDTAATMNLSTSPAAVVAEAGSRDSPALPPGLLMEMGEAARPTKLFIGGISRHTTTKQLRDHFSQFGRVLDCVAMRQPDGRPRGFGYVTLDSPCAADRCLREPQNIDNRIVDMKLAVPEGSGSYATSPKEGNFNNMGMFSQADFNMDMFAGGHGFHAWPESQDSFGGMPWWSNARTSPHGQGGLDCLELLSAARELAVSQSSTPHGLPMHSMGLSDYAECAAAWDEDEPPSTLLPAAFQQPPGAQGKMSASAAEFVPMAAQAAKVPEKVAAATPVRKAAATRAPLGELNTNVIVEVEDLLKPFKSPTNKLATGRGHLLGKPESESPAANTGGLGRVARPTGLLLDDELDAYSPSAGSSSDMPEDPNSTPEPMTAKPEEEESDDASVGESASPDANEEPALSIDDSESSDEIDMVPVDLDNLPSMGSAMHATGECKRCNFFPKGRCQNGKDCQFCHYPHDKRKPSRQEKRERRAAWLDQQDDDEPSTDGQSPVAKVGPLLSAMKPEVAQLQQQQLLCGPLLSKHGLHQGGFPVYPEEELYRDETLAYSIFPGLPPINATKLPAPLPLPGMDMTPQAGPALPPGLFSTGMPSQAEAMFEQCGFQQVVSSTTRMLAPLATCGPLSTTPLSTTPASTPMATPMTTPTAAMSRASVEAGKTGPALPPGLVEPEVAASAPRTLAPLATLPIPLSTTPASTPMSTPLATPTAAMVRANAEARSMSTSTSGTQTGDYKCRKCDAPGGKTLQEAKTADNVEVNEPMGHLWARDELLRLRDGLMKLKACEKSSCSYNIRTAAIAASASN